MKKLTREWVKKAEADFRAAEALAERTEPLYDQRTFLCQQASEKFLKALMEELGLTVPKIHDLEHLRTLLPAHSAALRPLRRGLSFLSEFAVDTRYPGDRSSKRQAVAALRWAGRVRAVCRDLLGIRPPRRRKKAKRH